MSATYEVLIAGAGPAGSHAATRLARAGVRVALIDRAHFPRDKTCGGGLSLKTLALLGGEPAAVVQRRFTGAWITWRDRGAVVNDLGRPAGCTVLRSEFDAWLVQRARDAGAHFIPDTAVQRVTPGSDGVEVETSQGTMRGRLLLAADGVASGIRAQVFGRRLVEYAPAVEVVVPMSARAAANLGERVLFDLGGMTRGYGWVFPKRDHLNVGVYSPFGSNAIRTQLDAFLRCHRLPPVSTHTPVCGYAIPVTNRARRYESGRVWLLGDAAGLAESLWGEGIYFALRSGELAAQAALAGDLGTRAGMYSTLVRDTLEGELRWSARVARLLYSMGRRGFDPLARSRMTCAWFTALVTGELGYRNCFWRTLLTAPAWLLAGRHPLRSLPDLSTS